MFYLIIFAQIANSSLDDQIKSYSFMTNQKTRITLTDPHIYLDSKNNLYSKSSSKITMKSDDANQKEWYYVHFSSKDLLEIKKYIHLDTKGQVSKNTYILHLTKDQLQSIADISLVKRLEPKDKLILLGGPVEETNYFTVTIAPGFELPIDNELFTVESNWFRNIFIVRIDQNSLDEKHFNEKKSKAIEAISSLPFVKSISTFKKPKIKNNIATGYTQRNNKNFTISGSTQVEILDRYFNNRNITGKGEIITVIDTLIDMYHAMFYDENLPRFNFNEIIENHRKFVFYGFHGTLEQWDENITVNEHGTHVSGTLAGKSQCPSSDDKIFGPQLFDGNAIDAKILYAGQLNNVTAQEQLDLMYILQSKISTNSWGVEGYNDDVNYIYGELSYYYPTGIFIYAAGNEYEQMGNFSVCDPGGSKNVLTVGALGSFYDNIHVYYIRSIENSNVSLQAFSLVDPEPYLMGTLGMEPLKSDIVVIDASAEGNNCSTIDQPQISLLFATKPVQFEWAFGCSIQKSNGILYTYDFENLEYLINAGKLIYMQDITPLNRSLNVTHAPYSSTGPANKGILKPDLMAPGTRIISAKSLNPKDYQPPSHGCFTTTGKDLTFMQGTSMATPNVAGAAALVRQYFRTNWPVQSVDLDGPTVRALLINSCIQLPEGTVTPNIVYGHGKVDLSTVLPIDNNFGVQITHQVTSEQPSIKENSQMVATLKVNSNKVKVQITLSYLDPLINPTTVIPLTRDLDLIVKSPSGKIYKGDHLANNDTQHFSTNEKVIINTDQVEPGDYTIHIYSLAFLDSANNDTSETQNFSVVATGDIENGFLIFSEPTNCGCSKCDPQHPLHCLCDNYSIGEICQHKIDVLSGIKETYTVHSLEMELVRVESEYPIKTLGVYAEGYAADTVEAFADTECHLNIFEFPVQLNIGRDIHKPTHFNFNTTSICIGFFNNNFQNTTFVVEKDYVEPHEKHKRKLSKGAIAGIVIGCVCGVALIIGLTIGLIRKKRGNIRDF